MTSSDTDSQEGVRLDKWLWAARFFKTRRLATEAVVGGKVQVDGQRSKPGRTVRAGTHLTIHKGQLAWELEVKAVCRQRRPATEAVHLYEESETSRLRRQELVRQRRESADRDRPPGGKPSKRDRRLIHRFTRGSND